MAIIIRVLRMPIITTFCRRPAYEGNGDGRPVSISWSGHDARPFYLVQIWANDGRGNGRTEVSRGAETLPPR